MRNFRGLVWALLALSCTGCCGDFSKGYNEAFCDNYKKTFLDSCNKTCLSAAPGKSAECTKGCNDGLAKDATYTSKCKK